MDLSVIFGNIFQAVPFKEMLLVLVDEVPMLIFYAVALAIYGIFVFHFYRQLAQRDVFVFDISEYKARREHAVIREIFGFVLYIIKYAVLFPLFSFFWFAMLAVFLFVLTKAQSIQA